MYIFINTYSAFVQWWWEMAPSSILIDLLWRGDGVLHGIPFHSYIYIYIYIDGCVCLYIFMCIYKYRYFLYPMVVRDGTHLQRYSYTGQGMWGEGLDIVRLSALYIYNSWAKMKLWWLSVGTKDGGEKSRILSHCLLSPWSCSMTFCDVWTWVRVLVYIYIYIQIYIQMYIYMRSLSGDYVWDTGFTAWLAS